MAGTGSRATQGEMDVGITRDRHTTDTAKNTLATMAAGATATAAPRKGNVDEIASTVEDVSFNLFICTRLLLRVRFVTNDSLSSRFFST